MIKIKTYPLDPKDPAQERAINDFLASVSIQPGGIQVTNGGLLAITYSERQEGATREDLLENLNEKLVEGMTKRVVAESNLRQARWRVSLKRGGKEQRRATLNFLLSCERDIEQVDVGIKLLNELIADVKEGRLDEALRGETPVGLKTPDTIVAAEEAETRPEEPAAEEAETRPEEPAAEADEPEGDAGSQADEPGEAGQR
jgi:hypothetical protein